MNNPSISAKYNPVAGAARYVVGKAADCYCIGMFSTDGEFSVIETAKTLESAEKKRDRWQQRENSAVTKAAKSIAGAA